MTVDLGNDAKALPGKHTALQVDASPTSPVDSGNRRMGSAATAAHSSATASLSSILPKWWRIAKIWFTGEERWAARGYAASVISLALITTLFSVHISYAQRDFSTALSGKDVAVRKFVVIIMVAAPLFSFNAWVEERLVLAWRAYMTRRLTRTYFANRAYFLIRQRGDSTEAVLAATTTASAAAASGGQGGIDNPDQRICDDVGSFVRSSVSLSLTVCRKVFSCVAFAGVLWGVSGSLVLFMFVYAAVGTFVTTAMFGRVLTNLFYRQVAREADLRFSLVRVRENAESIAFYRGEAGERTRVLSRLNAVLLVAADRIRWAALYDLWTSVYSYATILVPSLLTAPRYFAGEIEFGVISQASFAFSRIDAALSVIINNLAQLSGLAAETERLDALLAAMAVSAGPPLEGTGGGATPGSAAAAAATSLLLSSAGGGDVIRRRVDPGLRGFALQQLHVATPGGSGGGGGAKLLANSLSLNLEPGQSLLVVGPSGCGKSSLLRAIAGLWMAGSGTVVLPGPDSGATAGSMAVFFLPQKAFMPLGDLRTQLTFPRATEGYGDGLDLGPNTYTSSSSSNLSAHGSTARTSNQKNARHHAQADEAGDAGDGHDAAAPIAAGERAPLLGAVGAAHASSIAAAGTVFGSSASASASAPSAPTLPSDEELLSLLDDVCLPDLVQRVGGLDVELDWSSVLSAGEQQRVAVLRLLAVAPTLAFLDEATSALDGPTESRLYNLIRKRVGCYVSVGHRMQLLQYHTHVLECIGGGEWRFATAPDYQRRMASAPGLHL